METNYTVWMEIRPLAEGLKRRQPRIGYKEVKQGGRLTQYVVHTLLRGNIEIPVRPGRELEASKKLLSELETLARAYAPGLVAPNVRKLPLWMNDQARAFASRATGNNRGVHRFGTEISIIGEPGPTKQQIVFVGQDYLEAYLYFDPKSPKIQGRSALQTMANDWNLSMYTWVEKQGHSPLSARDKLISLNKELIRELIMALAIPGTNEKLSLGGDIAMATVTGAIRFR